MTALTTWEMWNGWADAGFTMLPYITKHEVPDTRLSSWTGLWEQAAGTEAFVLESGKGGRYTFFGFAPESVILGKDHRAVVIQAGQAPFTREAAPLDAIREWMQAFRSPKVEGAPKFTGGCAGFLGYDVVRSLEKLPVHAADDLGLPDYVMMRFNRVWVLDHEENCLYCAVHTAWPPADSERLAGHRDPIGRSGAVEGNGATAELAGGQGDCGSVGAGGGGLGTADAQAAIASPAAAKGHGSATAGHAATAPAAAADAPTAVLRCSFAAAEAAAAAMRRGWDALAAASASGSARAQRAMRLAALEQDRLHIDVERIKGIDPAFRRVDYIRAVERVQQYIRQGDVFQVNLSVRQSRRMESSPEDVYEWLRLLNPSPYMGLLRLPGFQLVSGSPELLVKLEGTEVRTRPIAGTRPRGESPAEDRRLVEELLANEKERAEHIMLVDLERNDLGRISRYGTVRVDELMAVETYSHVMHIVSEVRGELADGKDVYDVIAAAFPGGTITGAPKIRTMEIIEELEPVRRGPYTGAIGWIDYNGNMELNIVIRTLVAADGIGHVQSGAGIVIDSDPEREYVESINKAKALWAAIQYSERYPAEAGVPAGNKERIP